MIDGAGNEGYDVTYELSRQRNGKYLFSIVADETWINAEGRVLSRDDRPRDRNRKK